MLVLPKKTSHPLHTDSILEINRVTSRAEDYTGIHNINRVTQSESLSSAEAVPYCIQGIGNSYVIPCFESIAVLPEIRTAEYIHVICSFRHLTPDHACSDKSNEERTENTTWRCNFSWKDQSLPWLECQKSSLWCGCFRISSWPWRKSFRRWLVCILRAKRKSGLQCDFFWSGKHGPRVRCDRSFQTESIDHPGSSLCWRSMMPFPNAWISAWSRMPMCGF